MSTEKKHEFLQTDTAKYLRGLDWTDEEILDGLEEVRAECAAGEGLEEAYTVAFGIEPDDALDCVPWILDPEEN
jgi:hypothetical protein